ncbi:uncharacterized protein EI90DRAFT_3073137 [Cantharellus anzutake]|uniref:uncharacterized protein n=1 Tax=Cantharellus anzutake TaxID=1750568 RepID=UPI001906C1B0|nr:uncharacterized protein EI90DRAFT_3073137 [Cantharellus anzutake]KAF8325159.1 hypothetical protein EI90DRAFT_3073137 [Cantharellus anzutake]
MQSCVEEFKSLFSSLCQTFEAVETILNHDTHHFNPCTKIYDPSQRSCYRESVHRIKDIDEEVLNYLDSMEERISGLRSRLRIHHARATFSLAPISCLPLDILPIIFRMVVPDRPYQGCIRDVMHLSQVCTVWRQVAFSIKDLWRNIHIPLSRVNHLGEYLLRSGERPLHLDIYQRDVDLDKIAPLRPLFDEFGVWGRIKSFKIPYDILLQYLAETGGIPPSTPALQSLTIHPTPISENPSYQELLPCYAQSVQQYECFDAPLLHQLTLGNLDGSLGAPKFPHLRSLILEGYITINFHGLHSTLDRHRYTLETLTIHSLSTDFLVIESDFSLISVPHLHTLVLHRLTPQFATTILTALRAPALRSLKIHPQVTPWLGGLQADPFIGRNGPLFSRLRGFEPILAELIRVLNLQQGVTETRYLLNLRSVTVELNRRHPYNTETIGEQLLDNLLERAKLHQIKLRVPKSIATSSGVRKLLPILSGLSELE